MTVPFDDLNDDNFLLYASKAYEKPNCIMSEFEDDLMRVKYLKRLFKKFRLTGRLKERLILNHIIVLINVFGVKQAARIIFYKLQEESGSLDWPAAKSFLLFLNAMPDTVGKIRGLILHSHEIQADPLVYKKLQEI